MATRTRRSVDFEKLEIITINPSIITLFRVSSRIWQQVQWVIEISYCSKALFLFGWKVTLIETSHCFETPKLSKYLGDYTSVTSSVEATDYAPSGSLFIGVRDSFVVMFGLLKISSPRRKRNSDIPCRPSTPSDESSRLAGWPGVNAPPSLPPLAPNSTGTPA